MVNVKRIRVMKAMLSICWKSFNCRTSLDGSFWNVICVKNRVSPRKNWQGMSVSKLKIKLLKRTSFLLYTVVYYFYKKDFKFIVRRFVVPRLSKLLNFFSSKLVWYFQVFRKNHFNWRFSRKFSWNRVLKVSKK